MKYLRCFVLLGILASAGAPALFPAQNAVGIESLGHVGIAVSDLQKSLHFYVGQLGLTETFRLKRKDGSVMLVYLQVGDSSTFVELFPGTLTASAPKRAHAYHFGFFVGNLQTTLHRLQAGGYPLPPDAFKRASKMAADGTYLYFVYDPDGNRIELSQATPQSYQAKAAPELLKGKPSGAEVHSKSNH
ncbi:MAG TPA: VOC family protein [Terriglobia bacterium]|nr:VOC family protein [Terriglobia bacterium]